MIKKTHNNWAIYLTLIVIGVSAIARGEPFDGLTLFANLYGNNTFLIDNSGEKIHTWSSNYNCGFIAYLMPDSTIWRTDFYPGSVMQGSGSGGLIQQYDWDGNIIKSIFWSDSNHQQHHDICLMPNGNILFISWERKTPEEARAMGRLNAIYDIWSEEIIEYDPVGDSVVWEWHVWDHLIQDVDSTLPNYGVVREHPELIDINLGTVPEGDWLHFNSVDYNEERDEIVLASFFLNEIYVIDHSTTTEEARGHTGGRHNKGGDILYRWGNPQNYDRGDSTDRVFYGAHGPNWIRPGVWGAGDIIVLNNGDRPGTRNDYSEIFQITPPLDSNGFYYIHPDSAFGPKTPTWYYSNRPSFFTQLLGGVFRLPNGNTFVTLGMSSHFVEIDSGGMVVWSYNPTPGERIARAIKYPRDYLSGVKERKEKSISSCRIEPPTPNPFSRSTILRYQTPVPGRVKLSVYDAIGRRVGLLFDRVENAGRFEVCWTPKRSLSAGVYFVRLELTSLDGSKRLVANQRIVKE